jgi:hypothetical protein
MGGTVWSDGGGPVWAVLADEAQSFEQRVRDLFMDKWRPIGGHAPKHK